VKIDKRITSTTAAKTTATQGKGKASTAQTPAKSGDTLTLTPSGAQIQAMEAELAKVEIADSKKIATVKDALAKGTFTVNAEVVADRLIDHTKETLRKRPRKK
jgi:negative regulator of flagellin synthesis FlgM